MTKKRAALGILAAFSTAIFPALALAAIITPASLNQSQVAAAPIAGNGCAQDFLVEVDPSQQLAFYGPDNNFIGSCGGGPDPLYMSLIQYGVGYPDVVIPVPVGIYNVIVFDNAAVLADYESVDCATDLLNEVYFPDTVSACTGLENFYGVIYTSFQVVSSPAGNVVAIPPGAAAALTSGVSDQLGDSGTLKVVALIAGVYLIFWIMKALISLVPKKQK